jgi:hypothetical protein
MESISKTNNSANIFKKIEVAARQPYPSRRGGGDVDALEAVVAHQATALDVTEGATMRMQRTTPPAAEDRAPTPGVTSLTSTAKIRWNECYTVFLNVM